MSRTSFLSHLSFVRDFNAVYDDHAHEYKKMIGVAIRIVTI